MPRHRALLSVREAAFVRHFLGGAVGVRGNARRAATVAGYSERSARSCAAELLLRPRIQEAIAARLRRADLTADRVLEEIRRIAFADLRAFVAWGPDGVVLQPSAGLSDEAASAAQEVTQVDGHVRVKLHDKVQALTLLAKYFGLARERVDVSGAVGVGVLPRGWFAAMVLRDPSKLQLPPDHPTTRAFTAHLTAEPTPPPGPSNGTA